MSDISHKGKVLSVSGDRVTVEIISSSACAACHAKTLCGLSENVSRQVVVKTPAAASFEAGEEVEVRLAASMGHKAVWISYIIPLLLVVAAVVGLSFAGAGEYAAGLAALAIAGLWYFGVWLLRGRLNNTFGFTVNKL